MCAGSNTNTFYWKKCFIWSYSVIVFFLSCRNSDQSSWRQTRWLWFRGRRRRVPDWVTEPTRWSLLGTKYLCPSGQSENQLFCIHGFSYGFFGRDSVWLWYRFVVYYLYCINTQGFRIVHRRSIHVTTHDRIIRSRFLSHQGWNPAYTYMLLYYTEPFIIPSMLSWYDLNTV